MIDWFLSYIKKDKGINTARPRLLKFGENSEIKLTNVDPSITEAVENLLSGVSSTARGPTKLVDDGTGTASTELVEEPESVYNTTALGTFKDKDGIHCVAVLKFDPATKQAKVEEIVRAGIDKVEAEERFKILTIQKGVLT